MDEISLDNVYNIIDLCKYAELDGEKLEILISPHNNGRLIRIGLNSGFSRDSYEYEYENGVEFDLKVLPLILEYFLKEDKIRSWVTQDPKLEGYTSKELIFTEKENEFVIHTFDKNYHERLKGVIEDITDKQAIVKEPLSKEEKACEKTLKYLKGKFKARDQFDCLGSELRSELIQIIDKAYALSKGKSLDDEKIYNFALNIQEGISKEAFDAIANDIRNENSVLINQIRDYLKNEKYYENYLDEEPYMSLVKVGNDLAEHGYFDNRYAFPQKTDLDDLTDEKLKDIVSKNYTCKYKFLTEQKERYLQEENEEYATIVDTYMDYLVKTARNSIHKNKKKNVEATFKDSYQEYKLDDINTLVDALRLYKGGKLDSEKFEVIVEEENNSYKVNLRLASGTARDNNIFKFTKDQAFVESMLPIIIEEFLTGDKIKEEKDAGDNTLVTTEKNNELLIKGKFTKEVFIKNSDQIEFDSLNRKPAEELTPYEMKRIDELANKDENIKAIRTAQDSFKIGAIDKKELEEALAKNLTKRIEEKQNIASTPVKKEDDITVIDTGIVEKKGVLEGESKYLASYFRKEILREKGMLPPTGIKEIQKLIELSEDVRTLEKARQQMLDKTLSKEKYQSLHDYYRKMLAETIKQSGKRKEKSPIEKLREKARTKQDNKFDFLHDLVNVYEVKNIDGDIKVFNRTANSEVLFRKKEQLQAVEFANFWNSALGLKASKDENVLGEKYAFSEDSRKLFDIISDNLFGDSLKLDKIKEEFAQSGVENQEQIYNRLFKDEDYVKYVTSGMQKFNDTYEVKELDIIEENKDVKDILESYEMAESYCDSKSSASLKIHYPKEDEDKVEVYVTHGTEQDETVLYGNKFDRTTFMSEIFEKIVKGFVKLSGIIKTHSFGIPGDDKESFIAVGNKDCVFQMTNANPKDVKALNNLVNSNITDKNKETEKTR